MHLETSLISMTRFETQRTFYLVFAMCHFPCFFFNLSYIKRKQFKFEQVDLKWYCRRNTVMKGSKFKRNMRVDFCQTRVVEFVTPNAKAINSSSSLCGLKSGQSGVRNSRSFFLITSQQQVLCQHIDFYCIQDSKCNEISFIYRQLCSPS